jgi:hypothetical protein
MPWRSEQFETAGVGPGELDTIQYVRAGCARHSKCFPIRTAPRLPAIVGFKRGVFAVPPAFVADDFAVIENFISFAVALNANHDDL